MKKSKPLYHVLSSEEVEVRTFDEALKLAKDLIDVNHREAYIFKAVKLVRLPEQKFEVISLK